MSHQGHQHLGVEDARGLGAGFEGGARSFELAGEPLADVFDEGLPGGGAELPEARVGDAGQLLFQVLGRGLPAVL